MKNTLLVSENKFTFFFDLETRPYLKTKLKKPKMHFIQKKLYKNKRH